MGAKAFQNVQNDTRFKHLINTSNAKSGEAKEQLLAMKDRQTETLNTMLSETQDLRSAAMRGDFKGAFSNVNELYSKNIVNETANNMIGPTYPKIFIEKFSGKVSVIIT